MNPFRSSAPDKKPLGYDDLVSRFHALEHRRLGTQCVFENHDNCYIYRQGKVHASVIFDWLGRQLNAVESLFEDEKTHAPVSGDGSVDCTCGWDGRGKSYASHVMAEIRDLTLPEEKSARLF